MAWDPGASRLTAEYSPETAREVDSEIRRVLDEQHAHVTAVLGAQTDFVRRAARALLARETLTGRELHAIAAEPIRPADNPLSETTVTTQHGAAQSISPFFKETARSNPPESTCISTPWTMAALLYESL